MRAIVTPFCWAGLVSILTMGVGACSLFMSGDIVCETDAACPQDMVCGDLGICEDPTAASDAAGTDAGTTPDAASDADAAGGHDSAGFDVTPTGDAANTDSATVPDAAASACANPPCLLMPDSKTLHCRLGPTESDDGPCPVAGEDYYGQDGNYILPAPSYAQPQPGVVSDLVTGLTWEQIDSYNTRLLSDAVEYCQDLELGGLTDWRLPSMRELMSLMDMGKAYPDPAIDSNYFPHVAAEYYWSSSGANSFYWPVDFWGRLQPQMSLSSLAAGEVQAVRCVHGAQALEGDLSFESGLWIDGATGLQWQSAHLPEQAWYEALQACEDLTLGGHSDWRLPNIKELETLVDRQSDDESRTFQVLQTDTGTGAFWSSTPYLLNYGALLIRFNSGSQSNDYPGSDHAARCVRGP